MKVNIFYKEDNKDDIEYAIEKLGINFLATGADRCSAEVSNEEYVLLLEIPGIMSVEKVGIFDMWKSKI